MERDKSKEDTLKKLRQVEVGVAHNIEATKSELLQTRYYENFTVNSKQGPVTLRNVFITAEKDKEGKVSYHFRWLDENEKIIEEKILVQDGKVYTIPELEDIFGDTEMDLESLINENDKEKGNLKGVSEKATPEKTREMQNKSNDKKDENEKDEPDSEQEETQEIEENLSEQGQDIKIRRYREIKDNKLADRMPEAFERGKEYGIAEDRATGKFVIIEKEKGQYKINEKIQPGLPTVKRVFSIDPNGNQSESEIPDQLMTVKGDNENEIAATINAWGELDIETVHVTQCNDRIGRSVEMENEGPRAQEQKEVTDAFEREGERNLSHEIGHKKEELEKTYLVTEIHLEELIDLDIEAVMEAEAQKAKISKEGFKEYVRKADGKTLQEKISNAQEDIEQEYRGNNSRPR